MGVGGRDQIGMSSIATQAFVIGETGAIGYSAVRTALAVGMALRAPRLAGQRWGMFAQALADACYAAFPIAYVSHGLRQALGFLWLPLWLFAAAWEGYWYVVEMLADDEADTALEQIEAPWKVVWGFCFILPSSIAGALVALDAVYPHAWVFGDEPPPFICSPLVPHPGDTLTLTMDVPHGGELGAFTPRGQYLYVVPFSAASRNPETGFDWQRQLRLAVDSTRGSAVPDGPKQLVFADTGVYQLQLSEPAGTAAALACRVRITSSAPQGKSGSQ